MNNKVKAKIIFTDLDRTLLGDLRTVSSENLQALRRLGEAGIIRVIATGRSLFSFHKVIPPEFPLDYLIFSTGLGVLDWKSKEIIAEYHLSKENVLKAVRLLKFLRLDFMIQSPVPENHKFLYWRSTEDNHDFTRRLDLYRDHARQLDRESQIDNASQLIVVLTEFDQDLLTRIRTELPFLKIVRTTSPLDHVSTWIEIFPAGVSKGHAAEWLCRYLGLVRKDSVGIGNDYNDLDLLDWTQHSFVVNNAPSELKQMYEVLPDHDSDGFAALLEKLIL